MGLKPKLLCAAYPVWWPAPVCNDLNCTWISQEEYAQYSDLCGLKSNCVAVGHVLVEKQAVWQSAMCWSMFRVLQCVETLACQGGVKGTIPGRKAPYTYERCRQFEQSKQSPACTMKELHVKYENQYSCVYKQCKIWERILMCVQINCKVWQRLMRVQVKPILKEKHSVTSELLIFHCTKLQLKAERKTLVR